MFEKLFPKPLVPTTDRLEALNPWKTRLPKDAAAKRRKARKTAKASRRRNRP